MKKEYLFLGGDLNGIRRQVDSAVTKEVIDLDDGSTATYIKRTLNGPPFETQYECFGLEELDDDDVRPLAMNVEGLSLDDYSSSTPPMLR